MMYIIEVLTPHILKDNEKVLSLSSEHWQMGFGYCDQIKPEEFLNNGI